MLPLVRALMAAGHEVACASGAVVKAEAEKAGVPFFLAGPDQLSPEKRAAMFPEIASLAPHEIRPFFFKRVFTDYELPLRARDLHGVVDRWRPDVLVHEVAEFAGPLVAAARGLPYATHSYGPVLADDGIAAAAEGARRYWEEAGLEPHPRAGLWEHLYIDVCPPSLQHTAPAGARAVQHLRPGERGPRLERQAPPLVYVTLGTVYNTELRVFRTILDGLRREPVDVVVTVGRGNDPGALGPQPANVRVKGFVPQAELLPACSAVIAHGGAGSTFGALTFGCPVLFTPQGADQFSNAEQVVAAGAGLQLLPDQLSPDAIRHAVRRLLDEPSFREAAHRISDEIAAMPGPGDAAAAVDRLARGQMVNTSPSP